MHKILLVEDEKILRDAYVILLGTQGKFVVTVASNGQEALDLYATTKFDVILLDLMMPVLDGVGFLEKASVKKTSPQTKVIVLSNLSSGEDLQRAIELGADHHAVKSNLAPNEVLQMIDDVLGG